MNFEFTEEQDILRNTAIKFIKNELPAELIREMDEKECLPDEIWKKMAQVGFLGSAVPEEYGGTDGSIIDDTIIIEEFAKASSGIGLFFMMSVCFGVRSLLSFGNEGQRQYFLPRIAKGDCQFALALTEPGGGTDILGALLTTAVKDGSDYIINGNKIFISGAQNASQLIIVARTEKAASKKALGLTLFIADSNTPGITIQRLKKLGGKCCDVNQIIFEDVRVPNNRMFGDINNGWYHLLSTLNNERVGTAALGLGIARAAFEYALQYAKERYAFGKPIGQFQVIQHYLADSRTEIEMAKLLTYQAAWLQSEGKRCDVEATMAQMVATDTSFKIASRGMDILAGYGYMMEYDMQRYFRDSRQYILGPITNEMSKNYIGQSLGLPKSY